jgi:apolipoprotein N-acyltransferase
MANWSSPQLEMRLLTPSQVRSTGWACIVMTVLCIAIVVVEFLRAGTVRWLLVAAALILLYIGCSALSRNRKRPS